MPLKILDEVETVLCTLNGEKKVGILEKFGSVLSKNLNFVRLRQIYSNTSTNPLTRFNYLYARTFL